MPTGPMPGLCADRLSAPVRRATCPQKTAETDLSHDLKYFFEHLDCPHAFQVVMNRAYEGADAFSIHRPVIISAQNFLSQLV